MISTKLDAKLLKQHTKIFMYTKIIPFSLDSMIHGSEFLWFHLFLTSSTEEKKLMSLNLFCFSDIAAIRLPSPIEFTEYIQSIPLACAQSFDFLQDVLVVGNGISNTGRAPRILQYALLALHNIEDKNAFLALGPDGEKIKPGDSGGPLVALRKNGAIHGLVGIVSAEGKYNIDQKFTAIGAYFDWIEDITGITCTVWNTVNGSLQIYGQIESPIEKSWCSLMPYFVFNFDK